MLVARPHREMEELDGLCQDPGPAQHRIIAGMEHMLPLENMWAGGQHLLLGLRECFYEDGHDDIHENETADQAVTDGIECGACLKLQHALARHLPSLRLGTVLVQHPAGDAIDPPIKGLWVPCMVSLTRQ